ncbi:hypothetical protein [Lactococcus garvieae]|jgi:hypothetical protein|uniref:Bacteriocin n=1 Tax=Lactococcus garvieae DCC43 TaxID=1231377 RepID=K2PXI4_9LACT|nr:hypothetical protein [Lactococcus garvieae]EKF52091.1 hypothetical protein C426_0562 [Lactococcus garvieae DCC43]
MKKTIYLATFVLSFGLFGSLLGGSVAFADKLEPYGDITHTSDSEGYIHFDSNGNIVESNLESNTNKKARPAINHASGRWVYFSDLYDWGRRKKGHSNHYSSKYQRHGAKAKVGSDTKVANAVFKKWALATAYGNTFDTFSCWYNPTSWY